MKKIIILCSAVIGVIILALLLFYKTPLGKQPINHRYYKGKSNIYYHAHNDYLIKISGYYDFNFIPLIKKVEDADIKNFSIIQEKKTFTDKVAKIYFFSDKKHVYYNGKSIESADAKSFEYLGNYFAIDNKNLYYVSNNLDAVDLGAIKIYDNFKILCNYYGKDDKKVYYIPYYANYVRIMEDAEPVTFNCLKKGEYAKDRNYIYLKGKATKIDQPSFQYVGSDIDYIKDKDNVYYKGEIINGAESSSFNQVSGEIYADKNYSYRFGKNQSLDAQAQSGTNQNENGNQQVNQPQEIVYSNSQYGFSLTFPQTWKGYTAKNRTLNWGSFGTSDSIDFGFSVQESLFNVSIHTKNQWQQLKSEEGLTPTYLGENNQYVFGYALTQDPTNNDTIIARVREISDVVKTFKVIK